MHPILGHRRRLITYLGAWGPLTGLLVALLHRSGPAPWPEALAMGVPLGGLLAFICLASFYPTRSVPLSASQVGRILGVQMAATALSVGLWLLAAANLAALLGQVPRFSGIEARFLAQAPVLAGVGTLLYLLAAAGHALFLAIQASEQHARRALEAELAARQAELAALRAQLDPHFLFNTLNSIGALAASQPATVREMCTQLASFLRATLQRSGSGPIPLSEELHLANDYLALEKVRLGGRLRVEMEVSEEVTAAAVPPLLLQPLVENAVIHGVALELEGGTVRIEAKRQRNRLLLAVENPCGEEDPPHFGGGVGLANVRRRLATAFGDDAHLSAHRSGGIFRVECSLPLELLPPPAAATLPSPA